MARANAGWLLAALLLWPAAAPAAPRVVVLAPHLAELACAAGGCDRLVGVVAHSDHPPQVKALPIVGDAFNVDAERVLALQPDLVLAWQGGTPPHVAQRLRALGLQVTWIAAADLDGIATALVDIGSRLDTGEVSGVAAEAYRARLAALRARWAHERPPLRVLYQIDRNPIYTVGAASPISEVIALCGGDNVFADLPTLAAPVALEQVLARRPEVIVFSRQDDEAAVRAFWARWPELPAVRDNRLIAVNADILSRATPRVLDGVETLCRALDAAAG